MFHTSTLLFWFNEPVVHLVLLNKKRRFLYDCSLLMTLQSLEKYLRTRNSHSPYWLKAYGSRSVMWWVSQPWVFYSHTIKVGTFIPLLSVLIGFLFYGNKTRVSMYCSRILYTWLTYLPTETSTEPWELT